MVDLKKYLNIYCFRIFSLSSSEINCNTFIWEFRTHKALPASDVSRHNTLSMLSSDVALDY